MQNRSFFRSAVWIAVPVALQCMLQSSFSIVDQLMVGRLGSVSVAAVGIAGKFTSLYGVVIGAVAAVAGIMIAQYMGANDREEVSRSFSLNTVVSAAIALVFSAVCLLVPARLMGLYSTDAATVRPAADYLRIIALGFLPFALDMLISTYLRCMEKASLPLLFSLLANAVNTGLNYLLIFGKLGFSAMGANGAAVATVIAQLFNTVLLIVGLTVVLRKKNVPFRFSVCLTKLSPGKYLAILLPILVTEFLWSLGENVYASVYGHIGTLECAAMTLTYPIQGLLIGALSGLSQAAGILIGKELGARDYDVAYRNSKKLIFYGFFGAVLLSALLVWLMGYYTELYNVEKYVKLTAQQLLLVFAVFSPVKVLNMIIGSGILKSGGRTRTVMFIDIIGTWGFGVPLSLLSCYVFHHPITVVYAILTLEECVRLLLSVIVFRRKRWMQTI